MFERFTDEARAVVAGAQDQARELRSPSIEVEHLLLAMLAGASHDGLGGAVLIANGVTAPAIKAAVSNDALDPDALAMLGIDLDEVRRAAEEQFGPGALSRRPPVDMPEGHIPFTKRAKKVLEYALRAAVRLGSDRIDSAHLLLGIIREDADGNRLLDRIGVDVDRLRTEAEARATRRAA
jgi:ATP-dependent Clp protease ATP-binding subunit ClpA